MASEIAQLLQVDQKKYVPNCTISDEKIILETVPLHGDQLFEERARNTKWTYQDGDNAWDRIDGTSTEFADWHAKLNLFMVSVGMQYKAIKLVYV